MLLRHSAYYLVARGLPGLINFVALSVYTHLLLPGEYGQYALALATTSLASVVLFQWMQLGLLRFLTGNAAQEERLVATVLVAYLVVAAAAGVAGSMVYVLLEPGPWRQLVPVSIGLLCVQAWFEINLQLLASRLKPLQYGFASTSRAFLALVVGLLLIWAGWKAEAPMWGLVVGGGIAGVLFTRTEWSRIRFLQFDPALLRQLLRYGLPLSATVILAFIVSTSDRYLVAWLIDEGAAGVYAAGYDLGKLSLSVLMITVNLAAYPIVVRALEHDGVEAARGHLRRQGSLLLAIAAPATAGLIVLADNISVVLLGAQFQAGAAAILPWVAAASFLGGMKAYYYDLAFQLGRHTVGQIWVVTAACLANVTLNLAWIPRFGIVGAAWATVAAYSVGLTLSALYGRRHFPLPELLRPALRVSAAVLLMVIVLWPWREMRGATALLIQALCGGATYLGVLLLLDRGNLWHACLRKVGALYLAHLERRRRR